MGFKYYNVNEKYKEGDIVLMAGNYYSVLKNGTLKYRNNPQVARTIIEDDPFENMLKKVKLFKSTLK